MNLTFLFYLACPIGMGVMMWMMMRNNDQPQTKTPTARPNAADLPGLHQQLQSLESQQDAIMAEIQRLRAEERSSGLDAAPETTTPLRTSPESEA